ncbi:Acyl-CoA hydrolase [Desulfonatronum thiosulfatophilum]|uniref:Acyl-CoA hydrolase n=1 Tax=Desulfonatronum thiosulfatophilum TaxID=617002 RepID=A0A1G6CU85_9BACT|nr:acyl-CoA thioesterase [Desulfonatronum thiosulfatophilum]SDB36440.1 Acyl-CoA hydrolase [Desulfonatronum thiosulfatophilum]
MQQTSSPETSITIAIQMLPQDANPYGSIHGGIIMKHIDTAAGIVAIRHVRGNAVTASIDRLDFHYPAYVGDLLMLKASINLVGRSSMEVGVRVEAENLLTGEVRHTASAYLTFVALDKKGRPTLARPYHPTTPEQIHRHEEAKIRRKMRLAEKNRERKAAKLP